jgi:hypothetical protein
MGGVAHWRRTSIEDDYSSLKNGERKRGIKKGDKIQEEGTRTHAPCGIEPNESVLIFVTTVKDMFHGKKYKSY